MEISSRKVERMTEVRDHNLAIVRIVIYPGKNNQWMLTETNKGKFVRNSRVLKLFSHKFLIKYKRK